MFVAGGRAFVAIFRRRRAVGVVLDNDTLYSLVLNGACGVLIHLLLP
jgi:hypothetical protein